MPESVCAVVVSHNRAALLRRCIEALRQQHRPPDRVLVVDNASTDGTPAMVREAFPEIELMALPENRGGAGGFHVGTAWAYEQGFDWIWLMDDDALPEAACLEQLWAHRRPNAVMVPLRRDAAGVLHGVRDARRGFADIAARVAAEGRVVEGAFTFSFVGPLVAREVVARIGLPRTDFFIRYDDFEYALRARRHGAAIVAVPGAYVGHERGLTGASPPPLWKTYYDTRNMLHLFTRAHPSLRGLLWFGERQARGLTRDLLGPDRWERLSLRLRAIFDGARGRLGPLTAPTP